LAASEKKNRLDNEVSSIYNELFAFFNRYFTGGDFAPKIRHRRKASYCIPYSGQEVALNWVNQGQYYVKTGFRFNGFSFRAGIYRVNFELTDALPEQKSRNRPMYYVLASSDACLLDESDHTLRVRFQYRELTANELSNLGKPMERAIQSRINEETAEKIIASVEQTPIEVLLTARGESEEPTIIIKELGKFTRRNNEDFFVHKDLGGFMKRELDFFIKNEVLQIDELLDTDTDGFGKHIRRARVLKNIAESIIDLLAMIEEFQLKMFEKKKFVTRTEYCINISQLPESFWKIILENKAQLHEWQELYGLIDADLEKQQSSNDSSFKFLRNNPYLVVDTCYFDDDFKWRILAELNDVDKSIDGVLIKSENFQALSLLQLKYREKVKCIYIDPPYNTGSDGFPFRDNFQHSCWLSMMYDRLQLARNFLREDGVFFTSIDDQEMHHLRSLLSTIFGPRNFESIITWRRRHNQPNDKTKMIAKVAEFIVVWARSSGRLKQLGTFFGVPLSEKRIANYKNPDNDPRGPWDSKPWKSGSGQSGSRYTIKSPTGKVFNEDWLGSEETFKKYTGKGIIYFPRGGDGLPRKKYYLEERMREGQSAHNFWDHSQFGSNQQASAELQALFGYSNVYANPKPVKLIESILRISTGPDDIVMDFFAGSGTTAHAVLSMRRKGEGNRKYILVEMGDSFEEVILRRMKKVTFSSNWKDGKPTANDGSDHFIKYQIIEQYEDTLNNLLVRSDKAGQTSLEMFGTDYLLGYMLDFETRGSPSLLNLEMFQNPFDYKLNIAEGEKTIKRQVDIIETFNYLLGIHTERVTSCIKNERQYRAILGRKDGQHVAIVWRSTEGFTEDEKALLEDRVFIAEELLPALVGDGVVPRRVWVNGISSLENAEPIEPEFKRLMFGGT
jgi:adenine-specific DNA-methyltransferase